MQVKIYDIFTEYESGSLTIKNYILISCFNYWSLLFRVLETLTTVSVESAWLFRFKSFRHIKIENSMQKQPFGTFRQEGRRELETAVFAGYFEKCDKFSYES